MAVYKLLPQVGWMTIWRLLATLAGEKGWRFLLLSWNRRSPLCLHALHLYHGTCEQSSCTQLRGAKERGTPAAGHRGWSPLVPDHLRWHMQKPLCHPIWGAPLSQAVRGGIRGTSVSCFLGWHLWDPVPHHAVQGGPCGAPPQPRGGRWCGQSPIPGVSLGRPPHRGAALGRRRISAVPICLGGASSPRAPATMALLLLPAPCPARPGDICKVQLSQHNSLGEIHLWL